MWGGNVWQPRLSSKEDGRVTESLIASLNTLERAHHHFEPSLVLGWYRRAKVDFGFSARPLLERAFALFFGVGLSGVKPLLLLATFAFGVAFSALEGLELAFALDFGFGLFTAPLPAGLVLGFFVGASGMSSSLPGS